MKRTTDVNHAMYGKEPAIPNQVFMDTKAYNMFLHSSFNWYNNMVKDTEKKKWVIKWGIARGFNLSDLKAIPDTYLTTLGSMVRMDDNGFKFNGMHYQSISTKLGELVLKFKEIKHEHPAMKKITVDKVGLVMTVFDNAIDNVMDNKPYPKLTIDQPLSAPNVNELKSYYTRQLNELETGSKFIKVHNDILNLITGKVKKPIARKPKIRKAQSPKKQVANLNFMIADTTLGIKSIKPEKIIGASKLVMFNTNNRKLTIFYADDGGFSVKGSTLQNFTKQSSTKTIRKPEDKLSEFIGAPKTRTDKIYSQIKSVKGSVTGRINKHNILLKVFN